MDNWHACPDCGECCECFRRAGWHPGIPCDHDCDSSQYDEDYAEEDEEDTWTSV